MAGDRLLGGIFKRLQHWADRQTRRWRNWRAEAAATSEAAAVAGLQATEPHCRWESAEILGRYSQRSPEAVMALVEALADPEHFVRWQAARALAGQDAGRVFAILADALTDSEALRRAGAAEALGYLAGEAAVLALCKHLNDPEPGVRSAVASALGQTADPTALPCLVPLLADDDADVRRAVASALGRLGDPHAAAPLAVALSEAYERPMEPNRSLLVRRAIAAALARVPHPDAQLVLLAALEDPDPQVRAYAAHALGDVGNEAAYAALAAARADSSPLLKGTVGEEASRALMLLERRGRQAPRS